VTDESAGVAMPTRDVETGSVPAVAPSAPLTQGQQNAAWLRAHKPTSTDPDYLERMAVAAEDAPDFEILGFLDRRPKKGA
jgi:hypothetical protein